MFLPSLDKDYSAMVSLSVTGAAYCRPPGRGSASGKRGEVGMRINQRFPGDILADLRANKGLRIRAGTGKHRFIGIWFVLVSDRVFVRSWSVKPRSWYRTFLKESRGTVQIASREIAICAVRTRDKRVRDAVHRAYLDKYNTPGAVKYARDLGSAKSRATTLELKPFAPTA
jgi:hypothetical protein